MQNKRPTNNVHQYYPKSYKHVVDLALVFPQTLAKRSSKKRSFLLHMVYFFLMLLIAAVFYVFILLFPCK